MGTATTNPRPTIDDFIPGCPYSPGAVAAFLGLTPETVRNMIADGRIKARRLNPMAGRESTSRYLIDGAEVRRYYGVDVAAPVKLPKPGDDLKRAKKARQELDKLAAAS
jgi:hypothetical protein